jgi:hypothetical protein
VHLIAGRAVSANCWPCQVVVMRTQPSTELHRVLCAALWPGSGATIGLGRGKPHGHFWPVGQILNENFFQFHFGLNSSLNFENSYISIQSSKNHETNSVGFVKLSSTQEKY